MGARLEIVRRLELYEPTTLLEESESKIIVKKNGVNLQYGVSLSDSFYSEYFHHFPIVIDADGSPWKEANRYLLSKLTGVLQAKHRTLESIASDLCNFRDWLKAEDIDFLNIAERTRARPTYRYCEFLHEEIKSGNIKPKTAKRRMNSVQNLYRWLAEDGYQFGHVLWLENEAVLKYKNSYGFMRNKHIRLTDLSQSFKISNNTDVYSEYIDDGGKLRPLKESEQALLIQALKNIGNIEMLLAFLLSLTTGARLQTVFTMRKETFCSPPNETLPSLRLKVGSGTLINTKYQKQMVLIIPKWLHERLYVYLKSNRYISRATRSCHVYEDEGHQYAFLTKAGQPYYMAQNDDFAPLYRSPPRGNAVTQFIRQQLAPELSRLGERFPVRFHDLRATFGMNLLQQQLQKYKLGGVAIENQPEFFKLLMYVKERMGHSHLKTTEAYLNYRQKYKLAMNVQGEYETYLENLIDKFDGDRNELD